jgi:hypothetical protein
VGDLAGSRYRLGGAVTLNAEQREDLVQAITRALRPFVPHDDDRVDEAAWAADYVVTALEREGWF